MNFDVKNCQYIGAVPCPNPVEGQKRAFWIRIYETNYNGEQIVHNAKLEMYGKNCLKLDTVQPGQMVDVKFNVNSSPKNDANGFALHGLFLNPWDIKPAQVAVQQNPQAVPQSYPVNQPVAQPVNQPVQPVNTGTPPAVPVVNTGTPPPPPPVNSSLPFPSAHPNIQQNPAAIPPIPPQ